MSILDAYEPHGEPIITPDKFYEKKECAAKVCVVCFSEKALNHVLNKYEHEVFLEMRATANGPVSLYYLRKFGILFLMSPIGACVAGGLLQELAHITGIREYVYFGSCGILDDSLQGKIIVPTSIYREEGYSYHYAPPSDYLEITNHAIVADFMRRHDVDYVAGKGWSTDAIFNETKAKFAKRKNEGVLCVDMEGSGLQAIASHIGLELYLFFFAGDVLGQTWQSGDLGGIRERVRQISSVELALLLGQELATK